VVGLAAPFPDGCKHWLAQKYEAKLCCRCCTAAAAAAASAVVALSLVWSLESGVCVAISCCLTADFLLRVFWAATGCMCVMDCLRIALLC
jgi:hypothetical protein